MPNEALQTTMAGPTLLADPAEVPAPSRAWHPDAEDQADILCVEEAAREIRPRIFGRLAITLLRSPAIIRVESSGSTVAEGGSVLLIPAGLLHWLWAQAGTLAATTLLPGPSQLEGLHALSRPALVSESELGAQLGSLLAQLRHPIRAARCGTATRSVVERLLGRGVPLPPAGRSRATGLAPVRDYLEARLGGPVRTAELASLSGLTESHLIRAFHLEFGLPPHAYHVRLRLAAASELLARGLSVSAVTYECGFADQSHLSRKFKEAFGLTPARWANATACATPRRAPARRRGPEGAWRKPAVSSATTSARAIRRPSGSARGFRAGGLYAGCGPRR
jgi:AraC-like DNA-binding protein